MRWNVTGFNRPPHYRAFYECSTEWRYHRPARNWFRATERVLGLQGARPRVS